MASKTRRRGRHSTGTLVKPPARGKSWAIRWVEDGDRKYTGGYENKQQAQDALNVITARIAAGMPGSLAKVELKPGVAIQNAAMDWLDSRKTSKSYRDDKNRYDKHLAPMLGHRHLEKVTKSLVDELVTHLKTKTDLGPAGIERVLYVLSGFYRWAIRRELVAHNPVRDYLASLERSERAALRSQHDPKETPFLERVEVVKVFQALPEPVNVAYALSALAGLRPGEVVGVEWPDVDLAKSTLKVRRRVRNGAVSTPKSGKAREVPLVPSLVAVLKKWKAKRDPSQPLVVPPDARLVNMDRADGKVVRFAGPSAIQNALDAAFDKLKMRRLTFYEAGRHTFASNWVLAGLDVYRLSEIMGHASVMTTERYAHLAKKVPDAMLALADVKLAS